MTEEIEQPPPNGAFIINNPHDAFFRDFISQPRVYKAFIRTRLPEKVVKLVDLRTIRSCKDHFVDERLRHLYSDCLFSVRTRDKMDARIYVLAEHKSRPKRDTAYQVWKNIFAIWDEVQRKNESGNQLLPLVIPIVIYNGQEDFNHSLDLVDLIEGEKDVVTEVMFRPIPMVDLNRIDDEVLKEEMHLGVMFLTLKHALDEAVPLDRIFIQLGKITNLNLRKRYLVTICRYLLSVREDISDKMLQKAVTEHLDAAAGGDVMVYADILRKEGEEKGRKEGIDQTMVALKMIGLNQDDASIEARTGLSTVHIRELRDELASFAGAT
ncbi:MAG: Rpn family recombination-promoting nuclease/putative transposase [Acidobacteriota bacterium]|nr:Rpn family recombination-promoting nuclease/putative transposase [Acidobacteriota bacterium]